MSQGIRYKFLTHKLNSLAGVVHSYLHTLGLHVHVCSSVSGGSALRAAARALLVQRHMCGTTAKINTEALPTCMSIPLAGIIFRWNFGLSSSDIPLPLFRIRLIVCDSTVFRWPCLRKS